MSQPDARHDANDGRRLAVTLSGGGHRATLFALGALMYLVDAGRQRDTSSIASVSGGSITNGYIAQALDFKTVDGKAFRDVVVGPLASRIAQRGTLFAPGLTKLYLVLLLIAFVAIFMPLWLVPATWWVRLLISLALLAAWGWLLGLRGRVCARAFKTTLFSPNGCVTPLGNIKTSVTHVICATELRTAQRVYFSGRFVYAYMFGHGTPGTMPLYKAVQASAAFPGGFPPARLSARTHQFSGPPRRRDAPRKPSKLILSDGGVYDNMGDQWARGFRKRLEVWPELEALAEVPDQLVVVNASARVPWAPFRGGRVPLIGEFIALKRVNNIMYVNTTNVRRQEIVESFDPLHPEQAGDLPGALVQIAQSPFVVAKAFRDVPDQKVASRASSVIDKLGPANEDHWRDIARDNAGVATTLSKLGIDASAKLLYQGYVLAMCNMHVIFGKDGGAEDSWPLYDIPALEEFEALASQAVSPT